MVGSFYFALKSRLAGIAGRNKLLINKKDICKDVLFALPLVQGSGFRVQGSRFKGEVAASPPFFIGRCPEVAFKSPVTPTIRGKESSHMYAV